MTASVETSFRKEEAAFAKKKGTAYLERLAPELRALGLPQGSYAIVNVATGEYVTGSDMDEAARKFRKEYGKTIGWAARIDRLGEGGE